MIEFFLFGEDKLYLSISYNLRRSTILGFSHGAYQVGALAGMIQRAIRSPIALHDQHS